MRRLNRSSLWLFASLGTGGAGMGGPIMRLDLAVAMLMMMVACLAPTRAFAQTPGAPQNPARENALALALGPSLGLVNPRFGGVVSLEYARHLGDALWLGVRPELVLNLDPPGGTPMKASAFGLDVGVEWQSAAPGQARWGLGGAVGARYYNEPGFGGVARGRAGFYAPVGGDVFEIGARLSVEAGVGRIGDEAPRAEVQLRGDVLAFAAVLF